MKVLNNETVVKKNRRRKKRKLKIKIKKVKKS